MGRTASERVRPGSDLRPRRILHRTRTGQQGKEKKSHGGDDEWGWGGVAAGDALGICCWEAAAGALGQGKSERESRPCCCSLLDQKGKERREGKK